MMWMLAAAMALIGQTGEWLAMPMPDGFTAAHEQDAPQGRIEERIARGETVERWTRMITIITVKRDMPADNYAAAFEEVVVMACPGARTAKRQATAIGARAAIDGRIDCPLNPKTGLPETFLYRLANAGGQVHMVQVAFRRVPSAADIAWAEQRIAGVVLCAQGSSNALCRD
jgi:hypothetical protein